VNELIVPVVGFVIIIMAWLFQFNKRCVKRNPISKRFGIRERGERLKDIKNEDELIDLEWKKIIKNIRKKESFHNN